MENKECRAELAKKQTAVECLAQQVQMQKDTKEQLFRELDQSMLANQRLSQNEEAQASAA